MVLAARRSADRRQTRDYTDGGGDSVWNHMMRAIEFTLQHRGPQKRIRRIDGFELDQSALAGLARQDDLPGISHLAALRPARLPQPPPAACPGWDRW